MNSTKGWLADAFGNYTVDNKCTWLIEAPSDNDRIRLHIKEFATECGWDHLYVFDGDSVRRVSFLRFLVDQRADILALGKRTFRVDLDHNSTNLKL